MSNRPSHEKTETMEQLKMFKRIDRATLEEVIKLIERNYVENAQGRVMRQVAEVIVEDLRKWTK